MTYTTECRKKNIEYLKQQIWINSPIEIEKLCVMVSFHLGVSVETVRKYLDVLKGMNYIKIDSGIVFKGEDKNERTKDKYN